MNQKKHLHFSLLKIVAIIPLLVLPGCWPIEEGENRNNSTPINTATTPQGNPAQQALTGEVIVTMNGIPIVTSDSLTSEKNKLIEANPQFKMMLAMMDPKQFERNLSEGLMNQAIVDKYIEDKNISSSQEYISELQEGYKAVERMINTKFFSQDSQVTVSDADAKSFYDKNKEIMPDLLVSRGGVHAVGINFDTRVAAEEFLKLAEKSDLETAAASQGVQGKLADFKLVNDQSIGIPEKIKTEILSSTKVPATTIITENDNAHWVVRLSDKQEAQYIPFEQIKSQIKEYLEKEKRTELFDKEVEQLKQEYNIIINEDYFATDESQNDSMMQSMYHPMQNQDDDVLESNFTDDFDANIA